MAVKVLIVEDNPVARSFLCRVVRESFSDAIVITEAGDLESARRHIGPLGTRLDPVDPFKLILVDLELPDGNGMELLAELVKYPATKIVTTLYSDDDHLFPALQCGADGYLLKEDRYHGGAELQYNIDGVDEVHATPAGWVARRWDPAVQERFHLLLLALGRHFDGQIEGINLAETAVDFGESGKLFPKGFTPDVYRDAVLTNMMVLKRAFA